ncbi:MAG TPA: phospholipase D-like domain-containing protein [Sphingomicrobium sp.]
MLDVGRNCWRIERAQRAALIVDAADYFRLAREAMLRARSQIMIIGWDFDSRISLARDSDDGAPTTLGPLLTWLPKNRPELKIYILKWDVGALYLLGRGTTALRIARWAASPNINFKLDGAHAFGASHHQKILTIDDQLAFCGGIDMTAERWDTRGHRDNDEGRRRPTTGRRYDPWHDATMALDGPAARALGDLARQRWSAAGGSEIAVPHSSSQPWPESLHPMFREVDVAISRTRGAYEEVCAVREIEALFVDQIARAQNFVYAENQYFASRVIAEAVAKRLAEDDPPEFVIVNPKGGRGWLDDEVMSPARALLLDMIRKSDRHGRFRIYSPVTAGGDDIYVHSKITIVDRQIIRVGSANMNNRSMGLDSECDVTIDANLLANRSAGPAIFAMLGSLLGEHLGAEPAAVLAQIEKEGSLIAAIEGLRGKGRTLVPVETELPAAITARIAESELLDPESGGEQFEPMARPGLLRRLHSPRRK